MELQDSFEDMLLEPENDRVALHKRGKVRQHLKGAQLNSHLWQLIQSF